MKRPLLSIDRLQVAFGADPPAVRDVGLTIYPGQTVALVGESGSGKSTTAAAVLGLLASGGRITNGRIDFDGEDITNADRRRLQAIRGRLIGYVPQDPSTNLNPVWTIGFQIREALRANESADPRTVRKKAVQLLDDAGMTDSAVRAGRYPHQLSGGMCQRALIAIGLAGQPRLLIADEPTSALDVTVQKQVLDHLDALTAELGTAVLLITHDLSLAAERAEHLVVMYRGSVVESGPAQAIIDDPGHEYTQRLVASAPSLAMRRGAVVRKRVAREASGAAGPATSDSGAAGPATSDSGAAGPATSASGAAGPATEDSGPATRGTSRLPGTDPLLDVRELTKVYRAGVPWRRHYVTAVDSVSFRVRRATTTAVVGESGSGKTTVARMVLGLLAPTSGTVTFDGHDISELNRGDAKAFRRRVQPVFQNPYGSLDPMYSVYRTIEEPLRTHRVGSRAERHRAVGELLDQVALPAVVLRRFPRELSGGQRQRVAIARALALQPEMLVCDEAVSALDVLVQAQILALLNELQARLGLTYLFISHDLAVVREIADDVVVMCGGRMVEHAATEEVFERPGDDYTRRLLDAIPGRPARSPRG
jgi:peptide/nickel transport system ATP-binding protein